MTDRLSLFPYPSEDFIRVAAKRKRIDAGSGVSGGGEKECLDTCEFAPVHRALLVTFITALRSHGGRGYPTNGMVLPGR